MNAASLITSEETCMLPQEELTAAAHMSRLPADIPTSFEKQKFHLCTVEDSSIFCQLALWIRNPYHRLEKDHIHKVIFNDKEKEWVDSIFEYLRSHSLINFGVFTGRRTVPDQARKKVIVIGAGIAGLASARQLLELGFDVRILEAQSRIGGRIWTYREDGAVADLGGMIVTGVIGNPVIMIAQQIALPLTKLGSHCNVWLANGSLASQALDNAAEKEFNVALGSVGTAGNYIAQDQQLRKHLSLGHIVDAILTVVRRHWMHYNALALLQTTSTTNELVTCLKEVEKLSEYIRVRQQFAVEHGIKLPLADVEACVNTSNPFHVCTPFCEARRNENARRLPESTTTRQEALSFILAAQIRAAEVDLHVKLQQFEEIKSQVLSFVLEKPITPLLSSDFTRLLEWHCVNLEFGNAALLKKVAWAGWDQDDGFAFQGPHYINREGYDCVTSALATGLDVQLNTEVCGVSVLYNRVEVRTRRTMHSFDSKGENHNQNEHEEILTADAVVLSVPLGVLKANSIEFSPHLSRSKTRAIRKLGFGLINKVVLMFDKVFWPKDKAFFGRCRRDGETRGDTYMYYNMAMAMKRPILIAICTGGAAEELETLSQTEIEKRAVEHLMATAWKSDPFSRGAYSFIAQGSHATAYDILAAPMSHSSRHKPRLFFCGEHTCRSHPGTMHHQITSTAHYENATVHGALLSGHRAAQEVFEVFNRKSHSSKACQ
eukprot:gene5340-8860_t